MLLKLENINVKKALHKDLPVAAALLAKLYDEKEDEIYSRLTKDIRYGKANVFLAYINNTTVGVCDCSLRRDYVEGTVGTVKGYLEGIYVEENNRRHGVAEALVTTAQKWFRRSGCGELASDCAAFNEASIAFLRHVGLSEVATIVCFVKRI